MDYYERTFYKKISKRQDDMFRQMCINYLFSQFIFVFLSPHIDHSSYYVLIKMFLKIKKIFLREFLLCKTKISFSLQNSYTSIHTHIWLPVSTFSVFHLNIALLPFSLFNFVNWTVKMNGKDADSSKQCWKSTNLEDSDFPVSKPAIKL